MALRKFWWLLAALLVLGGCGRTTQPGDARSPVSKATPTARGPKNSGLRFKLSPANAASDAANALPLAKTTALSDQEIQILVSRLPQLQSRAGDKQDFALREASKPAPRTARAVAQPFPPPQTRQGPPPVPKNEPLKVTNIAPRGDVEMAPHLTVMFNQPMVPITTVESLAQKDVPVKLTPQPAGKWRWLGTQTLMFVPDIRFPMATEYKVEVTDPRLGKTVTETFRTPPPQLTQSFPTSGPQRLRPLIFVAFNQDVDPQVVAQNTRFSTSGAPALRPATRAEVLGDDTLASLSESAGKDRWAAFLPTQDLKPGQSYTVEVAAGMTSKEGPLPTKTAQSFSFATYQPLKIDWKTSDARPGESWGVQFNNELDKAKFQGSSVKVTPELPGLKVSAAGSGLSIRGRTRGRTTYKVTVSDLHDVYGQRLQKPETFTVQVGSAPASFSVDAQQFTVLDPNGPRELTCRVTNYKKLKVEAWKVDVQHWATYQKVLQEANDNPLVRTPPPGEKLLDTVMETRAPQDEETEIAVDLSKVFGGKPGHAFVRIEPDPQPGTLLGWQRQRFLGWVQSTRLGVDAAVGGSELVAWVSDLGTGAPLSGVEVTLWPTKEAGTTDAQGLATISVAGSEGQLLLARKGDDVAILPRDASYYWGSHAYSPTAGSEGTLWHVLDDRQLYRPGEKVSIKGWVRLNQWGTGADLVATHLKELDYRLTDSQGNEISKGTTRVGGLGGFHLNLTLPKTMNLGHAQVHLGGNNASHVHTFRVEEFRRPEFEVTLEASPSSSQVGSSTVLSATAAYFSGGPLANAAVHWDVSSTPTTFSPPGWAEYSFGKWTPWWNYRRWWYDDEMGRMGEQLPSNATTQDTKTDSKGKTGLKAEFLSVDPSQPHTLTAQATVQDVNRQTWTSSTSVLVHPASVYVGLKSNRTFVQKGQPLEISVIVTDLEGKAVPNKAVEVRAFRLDYEDYTEKHVDEVVRSVTSSTQGVPLKIPVKEGGTYEVHALVLDEGNRSNSSQLTLWVAGGKQPPSRGVEQEAVTLVPSKKEYNVGETAEILVQAPFSPAELLVTTRRNGLAKVERMKAADGSATVKISVEEIHIPGVHVQIDAVGRKVRTDAEGEELPGKPMRPAYASGTLTLNVSKASRKLDVRVTPTHPKVEPGASTTLQVEVKDASGKPASGEVTVLMVDESVLALTGYDPADPLDSFTPLRSADAYDVHLRQYLMLRKVDPNVNDSLARGDMRSKASFREADGVGGGAPPAPSAAAAPTQESTTTADRDDNFAQNKKEASKDSNAPAPPPQLKVRTNFAALAVFEPALRLDAQGKANVTVKLPDSLTRYRVIALAASGVKNFGKGESSVVARQPLMIRPSAPRFLNFGDHFQLPVVLQNQTDKPMSVAVVCRGANAVVGATDKTGYKVDVPANDRVEVRFPCAADQAGTARFQFGASAGKDGDAAEISLPVWTPATTEAFATYGVIDEGAISQPVEKPRDVWPQFGGLSVTTTSTALSELTDSFIYLASYPYGCSEQIASRILAAAALRDVLQAFDAPGMRTAADIQAAMDRDVEKLRGQQNDDGGWDYWVRNEPSIPYLSVHVAHSLVRVKAKGYKVNDEMLARALAFVGNVESHFNADYSEDCRRTIRAYAIYVMNLANQPQFDKARALCDELPIARQNFETLGWLLPTLAKDPAGKARLNEIVRHLDNHSTQTAATAQFNSGGYSDKDYLVLYSDRRDDGLLLESLITVNPKHPLIPKLVRGLLDHRVAGRWENTQENCWVLLALDKYFHQYESVTPDFVAELWLGNRFAGSQQFRGRDKNEKQLDVPMKDVDGPLVLSKQGAGRLYYRIGLKYAPKDLKQAPADYGFNVQRLYEAVGDNRDVKRDADGTWRIKAGTEVKITLTMHAPSRRYHVALVDPLPAGLEPINPALLGSKTPPPSNRYDGWWSSYWYNHQNLRDERVEAFTQLLWEGVYTYSYTARATTPGTFVVPPAKAEEMYHPETFGRSGSDKVIVE